MYVENERGEVEFIFDIQDRSQDTFGDNKDNTFLISFNGDIDTKNNYLELKMSKNAMLGLGTELLREVYNYEDKDYHVDVINEEFWLDFYHVGINPSPRGNDMHLYFS